MILSGARRGVVVTAHPDDETLWCGGLLARYGGWTVICCSIPRTDPIRAYKFFAACEVLDAKGRLLPFVESNPHEPLQNLDALDLSGFDCVVTHNEVGEYGHRHHLTLHQHIAQRWPDKMVTIGYGTTSRPSSQTITLTPYDIQRKHAALRCYDHISPSDGKPKWQALLERYGSMFDLNIETYDRAA